MDPDLRGLFAIVGGVFIALVFIDHWWQGIQNASVWRYLAPLAVGAGVAGMVFGIRDLWRRP